MVALSRQDQEQREDASTPILEQAVLERRQRGGAAQSEIATLAAEVPVALVYNGVGHAVMMASPADLEDFARGFTLTEGIARVAGDIQDIEIATLAAGIEARIALAGEAFWRLKERRRSLLGRTGCGLCGIEALDQALRPLAPIAGDAGLPLAAIYRALDALPALQRANRQAGSLHAAAFADRAGKIGILREDVGRHNALDKAIGAMLGQGLAPSEGFMIVTSRCSVEMVDKTAAAGIPILVAISAPTALAKTRAEALNLTVAALARRDSLLIVAGDDRIL